MNTFYFNKTITVFFITCCFLIILGICNQSFAQDKTDILYSGKGRMEIHNGVSFLWLEGTDYEAGYQYGALLKDKVNDMDQFTKNYIHNNIISTSKYLPFLKRTGVRLFGKAYIKHKIKKLSKKLSPELKEQMKGISNGSGVKLSRIVAVNLFTDFAAQYGCSGLVLREKNRMVQGRNFDVPLVHSNLLKYPIVVNYKIKDRIPYTNITSVLKLQVNTGFNGEGITFSENSNNNYIPFDKKGSSLCIEINKILTECRNLADVDSILKRVKIPFGYIYAITSTNENKFAVYDQLGDLLQKTCPDSFCVTTGKTYAKELQKTSESIFSSSYHNYNRECKYNELISKINDSSLVNKTITILSNDEFYDYGDQLCDIETINNFESIQSIVFDLTNNNVYFAFDKNYSAWNTWYQMNTKTNQITVYKKRDKKADDPIKKKFVKLLEQYELLDWKDSVQLNEMANTFDKSGINNFWCNNSAGQLYLFNLKNYEKTQIYADNLIIDYPDLAVGWYYRGLILKNKNKPTEAIVELEKGLQAKITNDNLKANLFEQLALINEQLGKKEEAKNNAQKSLEIHNQYWIHTRLKSRIDKLKALAN